MSSTQSHLTSTAGADRLSADEREQAIRSAQQTLQLEAQAILDLRERVGETFLQAVSLMLGCAGRVVVCGLGKTGHIARKMAATFASTGTPSFFLHAAEAIHGDIGMIGSQDLLIALPIAWVSK